MSTCEAEGNWKDVAWSMLNCDVNISVYFKMSELVVAGCLLHAVRWELKTNSHAQIMRRRSGIGFLRCALGKCLSARMMSKTAKVSKRRSIESNQGMVFTALACPRGKRTHVNFH
jgi:hypothetical protein